MEKIKVIKGDITKCEVDAIVNAANTSLMGGGGVDGAIHRAGGFAILDDCCKIVARQGGCRVGEAVITTAGNLPAQHVIHTVGPVWRPDSIKQADLLAKAYLNSLKLAYENGLKTIAFPNISTGIYHYPKEEACEIAFTAVQDFLEIQGKHGIEEITFVCFDDENYELYQTALLNY